MVSDLAGAARRSASDPAAQAGLIAASVFERIKRESARTPKSRTAAETIAKGTGNARDMTHLFLAAARAADLPARFVSGHCFDNGGNATRRSAHCWAEVHVEGTGWIAFDPAAGLNAGESYVRVAIGLDASDATPLSGTRTGGGIEELDVDVRVEASAAQNQ
jgi:transglutaminase-like putative cysteine protease